MKDGNSIKIWRVSHPWYKSRWKNVEKKEEKLKIRNEKSFKSDFTMGIEKLSIEGMQRNLKNARAKERKKETKIEIWNKINFYF